MKIQIIGFHHMLIIFYLTFAGGMVFDVYYLMLSNYKLRMTTIMVKWQCGDIVVC